MRAHHGLKLLEIALGHGRQGHPRFPHVKAHHGEGGLDRDGAGLQEERLGKIEGLYGERRAFAGFSLEPERADPADRFRHDVREHRNHAQPAEGKRGNDQRIFAAPYVELVAAESSDLGDQFQIAAGFFCAVDVGMFGKDPVGLRRDPHSGAGGDAVEHDGLVHRVGDGQEMPDQT